MTTVISGLKRCRIYDGSGSLLCEQDFEPGTAMLGPLVMPGDDPVNLAALLHPRGDMACAAQTVHLTPLPDGLIRAEMAVDPDSSVAVEFGADAPVDVREVWSLLSTLAARFVTLQGRLRDPEATVIDDLLQSKDGA